MPWVNEIIKDRRKREWRAFYAGMWVAFIVMVFGALWFTQLTGEGCIL